LSGKSANTLIHDREPPTDWQDRLRTLAKKAQLELKSVSRDGNVIHYHIVPKPGNPLPKTELRIQEFKESAKLIFDTPTSPNVATGNPAPEIDPPLKRSIGSALILFVLGLAVLGFLKEGQFPKEFALPMALLLFVSSGYALFPSTFKNALSLNPFTGIAGDTIKLVLRQQEELFNRLSAAQSASISGEGGLASTTLIFRANSARDDQSRIWRRSESAFRLGGFCFLLSLSGPIAGFWLIIEDKIHGWSGFFPSLSVSALMLTAAAALLRYDGKLREHYQAKSDEVSYLDRLQLAIDSARAISDTTYKDTLQRIIFQLVTAPPTLTVSSRPIAPDQTEPAGEGVVALAGKLIDASTKGAETAAKAVRGDRTTTD
jgi:hypothetical protein